MGYKYATVGGMVESCRLDIRSDACICGPDMELQQPLGIKAATTINDVAPYYPC